MRTKDLPYGTGASAAIPDAIKARAADLDFTMALKEGSRIYNSFDAHRLLRRTGLKAGRPS